MKFSRKMLSDGSTVLIVDIEGSPGISAEWLGSRLTTGGKAYAAAILNYNGATQRADEALDGVLALPASWLNDAGKTYYETATGGDALDSSGALRITVTGAGGVAPAGGGGFFSQMTPLQWGLIGAAVILAVAGTDSKQHY